MIPNPNVDLQEERPFSPSTAKPRRKLSNVQLSLKIQQELDHTHMSKSGRTRLSNKFRNEMIMKRGSISYGIAQHLIDLEKSNRMETERNTAETIYEIIRLANDVSDVSAFRIIKTVRKRQLRESDLPECAFQMAVTNPPEEASLNKLFRVLNFYGILRDDPRLAETVDRQMQIEEELENEEKNTITFPKELFIQCVHPATELISRAFRNELEIPQWRDFTAKVKQIFEETRSVSEGQVAQYIPQLARQDPKWWGFSMCTVDGSRYHLGDSKVPFCLQSVSKAFNYASVSTDIGNKKIHKYVGHEPSGRLFNEICLDSTNRPHNPMVNAGAIVVTSMVKSKWPMAERFDFIIEKYRKMAGTFPVEFNNATFLSERDTADRNYALAYYMKEHHCFPSWEVMNLREELELYFQLCSLECNAETLAVMAGTLANGGVNPLTYIRCITAEACRDALSLMYSCGMYDLSGRFSFQVGLPAKSGVSGAMMVVIPSVMGMCLFSPKLDRTGNSTRGVAFCRNFVKHFAFHNYDHNRETDPAMRKVDPRKEKKVNDRDVIVSLLFAVKKRDLELLHRYYMKGLDLEVADYDGRTALHVAASEGNYDIVKFLLGTAGVQHNPIDRWGHTPLDDAISFGHERVERVLLKYLRMELVALGTYEGSEMSDLSDFSDSEEEAERLKNRKVSSLVDYDLIRKCSFPTPPPTLTIFPLSPTASTDISQASTASPVTIIEGRKSESSDEEIDSFPSMSQRDQIGLPPIIKRPSSRGLKRV